MLLGLSLAALLAVRLAALGLSEIELSLDEAQYWAWSLEPAFGYFSKPPVIAWIIGATTSLCGDGEACVRLASPLLHAATSVFIFLAGARLYDSRTGFWAAIVYATAPGTAFSAFLISTDVPLLFFWAVALYAWVRVLQDKSWIATIALGIALGLGLLSKYAMVYFYLCAAVWLIMDRESRWILRDPRGYVLLLIPIALTGPNILWNMENGLVTVFHTADNANWTGSLMNPDRAIEFFATQFGVFGPILFGALVWRGVHSWRPGLPRSDQMLLAFSLPVIVLITVQAFLSKANPNWAAVAYPAAALFVTAVLLREEWRRLFAASLGLHLFAQAALIGGMASAASLALPGNIDPFERVLGWRDTAQATRQELANGDYQAVIADGRALTAELLYYLRDAEVPILAWRAGEHPRDHFELTRPYSRTSGEPVLLVAQWRTPHHITDRFGKVEHVGTVTIQAGAKAERMVRFYSLSDYRGR